MTKCGVGGGCPHGHAPGVADKRRTAARCVLRYEVVACKEADCHSRTGGPEEVVFIDGREPGVGVRRPDHAELERVGAEFLLQLKAHPQRGPGVVVLEHVWLLGDADIEVALVPAFKVRELVVGRQEGVGLAVSLDLGGAVQASAPPCPTARSSSRASRSSSAALGVENRARRR
jgi:hypothetical protein